MKVIQYNYRISFNIVLVFQLCNRRKGDYNMFLFEEGDFSEYSKYAKLDEAAKPIMETYGDFEKTTIFISHKHDDLEDLKGVIGFLEKTYNVKVYIDSWDDSMPNNTSGITAKKIKRKIRECDKFILLATDGAVESKWCNWELGFGDARKYRKNIALFPLKKKGESNNNYRGNEYMSIYPYIECRQDRDMSCRYLSPSGYYVCYKNGEIVIPLEEWFAKRGVNNYEYRYI